MSRPVAMVIAALAAAALHAQTYVFDEEVRPLLATQWGQEAPYNLLCPAEVEDTVVKYAYAGCGPLVMSQTIRRFAYPPRNIRSGHVYDYTLMFDAVNDSTTDGQKLAVAQLIRDCGTAAGTVYGQTASATKINSVVQGLKESFGYNRFMHILDRKYFRREGGDKAWNDIIFGELKAGRPVIMRAEKGPHNAHVFIIDGCRDSTVHVNWGWAGVRNGYYSPDTLHGFSANQRMVVGVAPKGYVPPVRTVSVYRPGTLKNSITPDDYLTLHHLKVQGNVNADDIRLLRSLAGGGGDDGPGGNLATLDLSSCAILALPDSAFAGCENLTSIVLPATLPVIGRAAFAKCMKLNTVVMPPMVSRISDMAFMGCVNLFEIDMPRSLRTIGANAFNSCSCLERVILPKGVTYIGKGAFAYTRRLKLLAVPRTVDEIGSGVIRGSGVDNIVRM